MTSESITSGRNFAPRGEKLAAQNFLLNFSCLHKSHWLFNIKKCSDIGVKIKWRTINCQSISRNFCRNPSLQNFSILKCGRVLAWWLFMQQTNNLEYQTLLFELLLIFIALKKSLAFDKAGTRQKFCMQRRLTGPVFCPKGHEVLFVVEYETA